MVSKTTTSVAFLLAASLSAMLAGCNDGDSAAAGAAVNSSAGAGVSNGTSLTISGTPAPSVTVGAAYKFLPVATDASGANVSFSIKNRPAWAVFDTATGSLSGTPTLADVGRYALIQINAGDGVASTALAPFSISVTTATDKPTLTIAGSAAQSVAVGAIYSFRPTASDAAGASLTFAIANKPTWAAFDTSTGALSGTPRAANVGVDANISITVSDSVHTAALTAFSISVNPSSAESLTLYWTAPSTNSNGTAVSDLAGYHIYYGTSAASLTTVITVDNAGDTSQVIGNLKSGTWYFAVAAFNSDKIESDFSAVLPVTI